MSNLIRTIWTSGRQPLRNVVTSNRNFSRTFPRSEKPPATVSSETAAKQDRVGSIGPLTHVVKPFHKYALVWTGKYKSVADVPDRVSHGVLDSALNKARVKIAIYMMLGTVLMACAAIYSGKRAADRGESLALRGIEYHKQLREQAAKEKEAAAPAAAKSTQ